jgi:catechol 2,3-dioxygenase-like lactoylglutathione lyase family enzyme
LFRHERHHFGKAGQPLVDVRHRLYLQNNPILKPHARWNIGSYATPNRGGLREKKARNSARDGPGPLPRFSRSKQRSRLAPAGLLRTPLSESETLSSFTGVIAVERVDFVSVPTRNVERARHFYAEVFNLPANPNNRDEFETGNVTLTLWEPEAQDVAFSANTAGIALRVADVRAVRQELVAKGVEFVGDTVDTGVCLMGFFYDPDGNVLILHNRYS